MKRTVSTLAAVVIGWFAVSSSAFAYDHQVEARAMNFAWSVDGGTLKAKMSAETTGWVAVGFNPSDMMKGANIIIGYVKDGKVVLEDHFGNRSTGHSADEKLGGSSDVTVVGGSEENGLTTIEFTIPLNSGDKYDGVLVPDGDTTVLMAYGPDRDSLSPHHNYRTKKIINLSTGAVK